MKTLIEVFNSVRASMHWGPAMEPFHLAVIEKCDELEARVATLEAERADDKAMMDMLRAEWNEMFPKYTGAPQYITDPAPAPSPELAVVSALVGPAAADAASLVDAVPEESSGTGDKADSDLLAAKPDPVPAGLDASQQGPGDPAAENSAAPSETPASDPAAE